MANVQPDEQLSKPRRVSLYGRVSSDDQAERGTVQNQLDFLRNFVKLYGFDVAGEYIDDGWSGTIPLADRPEGRRLLDDAAAGKFQEVLVYRLDRLGRSLKSLLDANAAFEAVGVTIHSATEPFETGTSIGRFVFQLLGSISELERETIQQRVSLGRVRATRLGKWTNGPTPFGYELDTNRHLVPSTRLVPEMGMTEADVVRRVYERISTGSSLVAEARALNALNVPIVRRWAVGVETPGTKLWSPSRLYSIIHNSTYRGLFTMKSREGHIERDVPALVSVETWEAAQRQLLQNRKMSTKSTSRRHLLRGLVTCEDCGASYVGCTVVRPNGHIDVYYRCTSQTLSNLARHCNAKGIPGAWLEDLVWQDCRHFIRNPGDTINEVQRQLSERLKRAPGVEGERRRIEHLLSAKDAERERVMTIFRRGRISLAEAEGQLDALKQETTDLRAMVNAMSAQDDLAKAWESRVTSAADLLKRLRELLDVVEATNNWEIRRQIVESLVSRVSVRTEGEGRKKRADIDLSYIFEEPSALLSTTFRFSRSCRGSF